MKDHTEALLGAVVLAVAFGGGVVLLVAGALVVTHHQGFGLVMLFAGMWMVGYVLNEFRGL